MRRLTALLTSALLLVGSLAVAPAVSAASGGACVSSSGPYQAGLYSNPSSGVYSVKAVIDPTAGYMYNCGTFSNGNSFSAAWVGIQPASGNAIVQLGVLECDGSENFCASGDLRYVAAYRGCAIGETRVDLGAVPNWSGHTFEIDVDQFRTPYHVGFFIDGIQRLSVLLTDAQLFCWIKNTTNNATWFAERGNRGDSLGLSSTSPLAFSSVRFGYGLTPDQTPLELSCSTAAPSSGTGVSHCTYANSTGLMKVWTVY